MIVRHGGNLAVEDGEGRITLCVSRRHIGHPVCGDRVVWQRASGTQGVVTAILPRSTVLSRPDCGGREKPLVANLTQLVVLVAQEPQPSEYLVDQYLVVAESIGVEALIVFNKVDLIGAGGRSVSEDRFAHYAAIGYPFFRTSVRDPATLAGLADALSGQTSILVGQSGVGKSSLVKLLLPDREIQIGRLSKATGLGRHTTSAATAYRLPAGGVLIDSPGVRSFRIGAIDRAALQQGFREFRPYLGSCRFADCRHDLEPGCAILAAVRDRRISPQRLASFRHLLAERERARPETHRAGSKQDKQPCTTG